MPNIHVGTPTPSSAKAATYWEMFLVIEIDYTNTTLFSSHHFDNMQDNSNFRLAGHLITFHSISIPLRTGIQFHWNHHLPSLLGSHPLTVLDLSTSTSTLLPSIFMPSACLYAAENSQFHNFVPYVPYGPRWVAMPLSSKNIVSLWSKCSIHLDFKQKEKATFKESWCYKGPVSCDSLSSQSIRGLFFRWSAEGFCLVLFDDSEPP